MLIDDDDDVDLDGTIHLNATDPTYPTKTSNFPIHVRAQ